MMEEERGPKERNRPGLLDLNLQISLVKNFHHLKYQLQMTQMLEDEYKDFPVTVCALQNLRGAVHFFLMNYESACQSFEKVLKTDSVNVNALRNLEIIHRQLGNWSKADEYKNRINFDDPGLKTTCYGEQGFAMMFDCHLSSNEYKRFKRSERMFKMCLEELEKSKDKDNYEVLLQWHLWYAQLLSRLMNTCIKDHQEEHTSVLMEGLQQCLYVKQKLLSGDIMSVDKKNRLLSIATTYIAIYSYKGDKAIRDGIVKRFSEKPVKTTDPDTDKPTPTNEDSDKIPSSTTPLTDEKKEAQIERQIKKIKNELKSLPDKDKAQEEIFESFRDPEKAFKKAVNLNENGEVVCRYALYIRHKEEVTINNLEKVEGLLDKCIKDGNGGDWFAYSIKSQILLRKCKQTYQLKTGSIGQSLEKKIEVQKNDDDDETQDTKVADEPELVWYATLESWLQDSVMYGIKAGDINASSQIYSDLGEAYHWLALNQKVVCNRDKYFLKSLANFLCALQHAEGYKLSWVHINHGECLFDMEQYLPALESFKRAIENGSRKMDYVYLKFFECYIKLQNEKEGVKNEMLADLAYWIRMGKDKLKNIKNIKSTEYWLDDILKKLKEQVQNDLKKVAEIEIVFANAARELSDRESFPVSDTYIHDNTTFALCLFGETLQLRNESYSENCIKMLDDESIRQINEDENKKAMCVQNVAKSFKSYKDSCLKSSAKQYLKEEKFLMDSFKKLHQKWKDFAELVAEEIKLDIPLLSCVLLFHAGGLSEGTKIPESPVTDMSMRELSFCVKQLDYKDETHQQKFRDCLTAFDKSIDKLTSNQDSEQKVDDSSVSEPKVRNKQYEYDFSVIYSENDSQWVVHSLLPTLERKYGFRGYVEDRDLMPGQSSFNILEVFEKCYKVIVLLTDKFCEDPWNYFVFQQAMYGKLGDYNLIPIQREEIKKMPKELTTIISLIAVQSLDWERLVKALESGNKLQGD